MKGKLKELLFFIKKLKKKHDDLRNKDRFNIFYALHKESDEVNLHSRFISYLLADNSGHGKGNLFAKLFFEFVLKKDNKFLNNYEVIPNEFNKTEFKEIDILLFNKESRHSIVIENKIYAKDSNHDNKENGYNGQLERYYNTILKGVPKQNINEDIYYESHNYISKSIDVFYLTVNKPKYESFKISKGNIPEKIGVIELYYKNEIVKWLEHCLKETKKEDFLNQIINQYLILVKNMTKTNIPEKELNELRNIYSNDLETTQYLINNFKDIKWHTVDYFFNNLKEQLESEGYSKVNLYPDNIEERANLITELTHNNKDVNIGVTFTSNKNEKLYISSSNNLSWGIINAKWKDFSDNNLENIRFSDFNTNQTYNLISKKNTDKAIVTIIDDIKNEEDNNFKGLKSI